MSAFKGFLELPAETAQHGVWLKATSLDAAAQAKELGRPDLADFLERRFDTDRIDRIFEDNPHATLPEYYLLVRDSDVIEPPLLALEGYPGSILGNSFSERLGFSRDGFVSQGLGLWGAPERLRNDVLSLVSAEDLVFEFFENPRETWYDTVFAYDDRRSVFFQGAAIYDARGIEVASFDFGDLDAGRVDDFEPETLRRKLASDGVIPADAQFVTRRELLEMKAASREPDRSQAPSL